MLATPAYTCSVAGKISGLSMLQEADAIIRTKAIEYSSRPPREHADGTIPFRVLETIRGTNKELVLPGRFVEYDDFNDKPVPYDFVRPTGRMGSCYTSFYREGAEYLFFLKKTKEGAYTTEWSPLAPVNEQLHAENDPGLLWTRGQERKLRGNRKQ